VCVCVVLCAGRGSCDGLIPVKGVLPTVHAIVKLNTMAKVQQRTVIILITTIMCVIEWTKT
jgi:hypothetical protein